MVSQSVRYSRVKLPLTLRRVPLGPTIRLLEQKDTFRIHHATDLMLKAAAMAAALSMRSVAWCILKVSFCSSNRIVGPRGTRLSVNGNLTREYRTDCETIGNRKTAAATEVPGDQARNQGKGKNGALQHPYDKDGNPTLDESWCYNRNSENCLIAWKFLMAQLLREP